MIWGKTTKEKLTQYYSVGKWFAWRPVQLEDGRWVWWEYVWCHSWRKKYNGDAGYRYERYTA